jgi:hypothetical protein
MQPLDSLHGQGLYGVGNNPFLLEFLAYGTRHPLEPKAGGSTAASDNSQTSAGTASGSNTEPESMTPLVVDIPRLSMDPNYLVNTLGTLLQRARLYFLYGYYDASLKEYRDYLHFEHLYSQGYTGITADYFQVLFEFSWLASIHHREKESERILNESLLRLLDPLLHKEKEDTTPKLLVRQFIQAMQELGQLPSNAAPRVSVQNDTLMKLVKKLISQGEPETARLVLGHLEVRNLLMLFQADYLSRKLYAQTNPRSGGPPVTLPIIYTRIGLPYAPINPKAKEADHEENLRERHNEDHPHSSLFAHGVDRVFALGKDPNEGDERERRQHQAQDYRTHEQPAHSEAAHSFKPLFNPMSRAKQPSANHPNPDIFKKQPKQPQTAGTPRQSP